MEELGCESLSDALREDELLESLDKLPLLASLLLEWILLVDESLSERLFESLNDETDDALLNDASDESEVELDSRSDDDFELEAELESESELDVDCDKEDDSLNELEDEDEEPELSLLEEELWLSEDEFSLLDDDLLSESDNESTSGPHDPEKSSHFPESAKNFENPRDRFGMVKHKTFIESWTVKVKSTACQPTLAPSTKRAGADFPGRRSRRSSNRHSSS